MTETAHASDYHVDYVLGLDPGINAAGVAFIDNRAHPASRIASWHIQPSSVQHHWTTKIITVLIELEYIVERIERDFDVDLFAYEAAHYQNNHQTMRKLAQVNGAWRLLAHSRIIPVIEVQPIEAKHAISAHNEAGPRDMKNALRVALGGSDISRLGEHEVSAAAIAIAGAGLYLDKYLSLDQ